MTALEAAAVGLDRYPKGTSESSGCCCAGMDYLFSLHMLLGLGEEKGRGGREGK